MSTRKLGGPVSPANIVCHRHYNLLGLAAMILGLLPASFLLPQTGAPSAVVVGAALLAGLALYWAVSQRWPVRCSICDDFRARSQSRRHG